MSRTSYLSFAFALAAFLGLGVGVGCDGAADDSLEAQRLAVMAACHLDDGTIERDADLHACDPQSTKKTTICHVPPGNPANAHTICVGNAAVPHHLRNHDDYLGPCKREVPCPPPGTGSGGATGSGGSGDTGGSGGSGGAAPTGGGGTMGGDAGAIIVL